MRFQSAAALPALMLLWVALPSTAVAQERAGFWISGGLRLKSVGGSIDSVPIDRGGTGDITISLGWTLTPQLLIGVEASGYGVTLYNPAGVETTGTNSVVSIPYYPRGSSGFFVRGGVGPTFLDNTEDSPPAADISGKGIAVMGGAGYDFYLGRNFSLTSAVDYWYGDVGNVEFDQSTRFTDWKHNAIGVLFGIKFN
jgi:hypothetical protein